MSRIGPMADGSADGAHGSAKGTDGSRESADGAHGSADRAHEWPGGGTLLPLLFFFLLLLIGMMQACLPTDVERTPDMLGPDEVIGIWSNYQIVCTVPLTITTPYAITITGGDLSALFPARGHPKALVEQEFTAEEVEGMWGPGIDRMTTRSLEIVPVVQFEDYRATISFGYEGNGGGGTVTHSFDCRSSEGSVPHR